MARAILTSLSSRPRRGGSSRAFTLVEALISSVILAFAATVMSALYITGLQALAAQSERALLDSQLRSRMEALISEKFGQLASGTDTVTVEGQDYTIVWTVAGIDLDGDSAPESDAKQVTVALEGSSLTTLIVDGGDGIGKI